GLALIGCHTRGGIALDVFDGSKAFAGGEPKVASCHIVLPVDERLLVTRCLRLRQYAEVGLAGALGRVPLEAALRAAGLGTRRRAGRRTIGQHVGETIDAAA